MDINQLIEKEFTKRSFKPATKSLYQNKLSALFNFYDQLNPKEINFDQIDSFIYRLKSKESPSSMKQYFHAFKLFYNEVLGKNFPFYKLRLPQTDSTLPELLTQIEIRNLLNSVENLKHKTLLTLLYSTGIRSNELQALTIKDILSDQSKIRIRNQKNGKIRYAFLSNKLLILLREYYRKEQPQKFLFEGQKPKTQYSDTSIRKILEKAVSNCGINKKTTLNTLRYCYVKHSVEQGQSHFLQF